MAPPNGSSKPRKAGASKQLTKPVMPALPLPYVKRQAAAAAAAAAAASNPTPPPSSSPEPSVEKHQVNREGRGDEWQLAETKLGDVKQPKVSSADAVTNGSGPIDMPATGGQDFTTNGKAEAGEPATQNAVYGSARMQVVGNVAQQAVDLDGPSETPIAVNGVDHDGHGQRFDAGKFPRLHVWHHRLLTPSKAPYYPAKVAKHPPPPAVSPTRYQMPPPFLPANRPMGSLANGDMSRGPLPHPPNPPHHMHQSHASNGSIHFGTFHDSESSSPAPPHSGGIAPPPGIPGPDGRPAYMGHASNGFPPMMPYGADMMQAAGFDNYGRPPMAYGPMDQYPRYGNTFGHSTPHSFHGSQSSAHPEEGGIYGQFPLGAIRNGGVPPGEEMHAQDLQGRILFPADHPRMMHSQGPPPMLPHGDDGDGVLGYLQQAFASPELADCTLELRHADDGASPVRIPGHRLVFGRSPELAALLRKQGLPSAAPDGSARTLLVETDDRWVRSDAFYMAVQRLYGFPLLHHVPPHGHGGADSADVMQAGSVNEQFQFALSYAAAGRLLDWAPVIHRGCDVATQLLSWQTMEKGLEFALDGCKDDGTHESFRYGDGSRAILNAVVTYVVHNLPPSFNLDTSADEPSHYARLPMHLPPPPTAAPAATSASEPAIARGTSVQLGKGRRSQQINNIQFGDLLLSEDRAALESETPKATRQAQPVAHAILSRVLLNLPFMQLKMILESSGSGNVNGWANTETRYGIVKRVVEEREARRLRLLEAVASGRVTVREAIRTGLRRPMPHDMGRWGALGWQEEILPYGINDGPSLGRTWVPLMEVQNGSAADYP
ncbi:hypothetical protein DCS_07775 [Drechmeria coniospora]|uniref:Uncharacterized protein n=1 Tax=Drechmeria coniospora TaxID=98403 RepID=A0A151GFI5_DRECN|nr:hypothetical protein DCS_07775 [Drechmeria coniospora]KYK55811.1 hypothetical protein DCS_07775 [Drechmeria coniospora]